MTVNNMLHMAVLNGIQVMAITDHNSCKNCPAAMEVAKGLPIDLIPGMELCTSEAVSYTHLDVYKRQGQGRTGSWL